MPIFNDAMKRGLGESVFHYRFLAFAGDSTAYEKLRQPHNGSTELLKLVFIKGQLNSKWIYEVIVSPKMLTNNYQDFFPGSLVEGKTEILVIFSWHFGRKDDLTNSFWIYITNLQHILLWRKINDKVSLQKMGTILVIKWFDDLSNLKCHEKKFS